MGTYTIHAQKTVYYTLTDITAFDEEAAEAFALWAIDNDEERYRSEDSEEVEVTEVEEAE